jgi:serine/threonine protein kinase
VIGETVGSYKIESKLGEGGMGVVYVAEHPLLKKKAVVKFLHADLSGEAETVERFFNEARAATMIRHPGIVDVFDFGKHASGCAYILMEFLHGESLSARIKTGPVDPGTAILIGKQIAAAVGAAHDGGIVHRDLKPDNIFLIHDREAPGGVRVKVLDFGIAKLVNESAGSVKTQIGTVMGTPTYMAPEQCRSAAEVDHRADIYALGCILFELVCGKPPFRAHSIGQLIAAHMFEDPPTPSSVVATVPADLEDVILRALAKEPDERQGSMSNLAVELAACSAMPGLIPTPKLSRKSQPVPVAYEPTIAPAPSIAMEPTVAPIIPLTVPAPPATVGHTLDQPELTTLGRSHGEITVPPPPKRRTGAIVSVAAAMLAAGIAIVVWQRGGSSAEPIPAAAPAPPPTKVVFEPRSEQPAAPPVPATITVSIESEPAGATVIQDIDGMRIGRTPFDRRLAPVAGGTLVYILRLEGFEDTRVELAADRDDRETVALKPRAKKPPGRPIKPPTSTPRDPPPVTTGPTPEGMLRPKH